MAAEKFEWNVCRVDPEGQLWDIFEDEECEDQLDAEKQRAQWENELQPELGDDRIVVIRRVPPVAAGAWEIVEAKS